MNDSRPVTIFNVGALHFGAGSALDCATDFRERRLKSAFLVTTEPTIGLCEPLIERLRAEGIAVTLWHDIAGEPTLADFAHAMKEARACKADSVIGLGGGSAMDVAKMVAALFDGHQDINDVIGVELLARRALPLACIPTTAGTGSEVTNIAILDDQDADLKKGVVSRYLVPDFAYLDPQLTVSMPPAVTASTGLDALTHCIEAYANKFSHPLVDVYALAGIKLINAHIARAYTAPNDLDARAAMQRAALYGGLCLGPVNTAAVHALAYPLGSEFHVPHGVANSLLLTHVLRFNLEAAPRRYAEVAEALGIARSGDDMADANAGIDRIAEISRQCGIKAGLSSHGISTNAIPGMAAAAMSVTRLLERNLRVVTEEDARKIYEAAL